jgi:hypothetical protein
VFEREYSVKNLGILFDETLSWSKQVNLITAKAYGKLRQAYRFNKFLSPQAKWNLSETYILSQFNYGDIILQGLTNQLINKIQKIQNSCIRFSFGLRKYDHVTPTRISNKILCMQDRSLLHSLTLMFKISKKLAPIYLSNRITHQNNLHNYNTRRRNDIAVPFARRTIRSSSFFVHIAKKFNDISGCIDCSGISVNSFKNKCKDYLRNKEN